MEAVPVRRMWASRVKEEQDEIRKSKVNNPVIPHRVWTKEDDERDLAKAKNFDSSAPAKAEDVKEEKSGEKPEADTKKEENGTVSSETEASKTAKEVAPVVKVENGVKEEKDEDDEAKQRQDLLAKRLREERSVSAMNKRLRVVNNFEELPRVGGIDTQQALPSQV